MKRIVLINLVVFLLGVIINKANAQTQQLKMTVTNDILDCPHFSMVMDNIVEKKLNGTLVEKKPKEKYIIYQIPKSKLKEEEIITIYRAALDSIYFPVSSIKEIKIENE